jgi:type IV secretory pathway TrbF-like protein
VFLKGPHKENNKSWKTRVGEKATCVRNTRLITIKVLYFALRCTTAMK